MKYRNFTADSIRGIAAINVMNAHFICAFFPYLLSRNYVDAFGQAGKITPEIGRLHTPLLTLAYNGHFAVILFFVLSGYVLSGPYFSDNIEKIKARLAGRYLRLNGPIAMSILFAFIIGALGLYSNHEAGLLTENTWLQSQYNSNSFLLDNLVKNMLYLGVLEGSPTFNPPLWSLKVEMLGSIFLLTTLLIFPPKHFYLGALISLTLVFGYFGYSKFFLWVVAIYLGALIHRIPFEFRSRFINTSFVIFGLYLGAFQYNHLFYDWVPKILGDERKDITNIIGAILVLAPLLRRDFSIFKNSIGDFLGRLSYSIYLLHFPILCSVACFMYLGKGLSSNIFLIYITYVVLTFICAYFFERFVDRPSHKIARRFGGFVTRK